MKRAARLLLLGLLATLLALPVASKARAAYSQAELERMLAPIALYPDNLLHTVLTAARYPYYVTEAARWTRYNAHLRGDAALREVQYMPWDPSVKSLVAHPQVLQQMQAQPGWVESLGNAFLWQEPQVMDAVQELRRRAWAANQLQPPQVVYVPHVVTRPVFITRPHPRHEHRHHRGVIRPLPPVITPRTVQVPKRDERAHRRGVRG